MSEDPDRGVLPHPLNQPTPTGWLRFDLIAALVAIFISLTSMVVAIRSEATQSALLAASSWPFVQLSVDRDTAAGTEAASISVENEGVGPAKVISFEAFFDGKPVDSVTNLLQRCCGFRNASIREADSDAFRLAYGDVAGNVLRPGERITAMTLRPGKVGREMFDRFSAALPRLAFRGCYCSVLDRCWLSDLRGLSPRQVDSCPATPHQFILSNSADR